MHYVAMISITSEPGVAIVASTTLKETGPAVFAMFVLRVLRAPKGEFVNLPPCVF